MEVLALNAALHLSRTERYYAQHIAAVFVLWSLQALLLAVYTGLNLYSAYDGRHTERGVQTGLMPGVCVGLKVGVFAPFCHRSKSED